MDDLRFPIGEFNFKEEVSENQISSLIDQIEALPLLELRQNNYSTQLSIRVKIKRAN
ncbi:hypothetical protein JCM17380_26990 [Desulfosporosinus burensis]